MQEFIRTRGITRLPAGTARGTDWHKPPAYASPREETEWLNSHRATAKCNEENLAKAKILTMLENLAGKTKEREHRWLRRDEAYRWFFEPRSDFEDWCEMAGYDADYIREQARKVFESGLPQLRVAPGKGKRYEERKRYYQSKKR